MSEALLQAQNLKISVGTTPLVHALSFNLKPGETLGIVGESGSGKSLSSLAIMGLLPHNLSVSGELIFKGQDLLKLSQENMGRLRGKEIAMIFQEPMSALNPSMRCGAQVAEMLETHTSLKASDRKKKVLALFKEVELPRATQMYTSYPHQLSGGQKQRVMIAMALACKPQLLIADEPTTALDVSVQAGILKLLKKLQTEYGMALIFISHDLQVVHQVADSILVLHRGEVKEYATADEVFNRPKDPYTKGLLACRPTADSYERRLPLVRDFLLSEIAAKDIISPRVKEERSLLRQKQTPLFEVKNIGKIFKSKAGIFKPQQEVAALSEISLKIYPGESLGLVGESGSGKTTLGRILVGLEKPSQGQVFYDDKDIAKASTKEWRQLHRKIQIIFQDPFASLNPRLKIGVAIAEVLQVQRKMTSAAAKEEAEQLLEKVGLLKEYYQRYPHEFSGGQRQRIGIARALAVQPEFIVCDESVSALDVSVQAQILNLLNDLKDEFGFTYLFISHDLNVVKYFCDRIVVLQNGQLVEEGLAEDVYRQPKNEYTQALIAAGKGS
jgi:peptide/nickel transport system ATP-binding protein